VTGDESVFVECHAMTRYDMLHVLDVIG